MYSVRAFPRLDKSYEVSNGQLHIKPLDGIVLAESIYIGNATVSFKKGIPFGLVTVNIPEGNTIVCDGMINPKALADAMWKE